MEESVSADRIQKYRDKAKELRENAAQTSVFDIRQQLVDIAVQYDSLADDIERRLSRGFG